MGMDTYLSRYNNALQDEFYVRKSYLLTGLLEKNAEFIGGDLQFVMLEDVEKVIKLVGEVARHKKQASLLLEEHLLLFDIEQYDLEDVEVLVRDCAELKKYIKSITSDDNFLQDFLFLDVVR